MTDEKKTPEVSAQPTQNAQQAVPLTEAELIWNEIKNKDIMMFSLPAQKVSDYCKPVPVEPSRCFLLYKASSAIPAVEAALGPNFQCEAADKYLIVSRKKQNAF